MRPMLLYLLILLLSACALQPATSIEEIPLTLVAINTPQPATFTPQPQASSTHTLVIPTQQSTGQTINTTVSPIAEGQSTTISNCTTRVDLPTYTVVAGDTLSSIAARSNSRVSELVEWNCLANANMITAGMYLRVARIVPTLMPTATFTPLPSPTPVTPSAPTSLTLGPFGALGLSPAIQAGTPEDWRDFVIEPQATITIHWSGIDPEYYAEVGKIQFFYTADNLDAILIGTDMDKSDGMSITWTTPMSVSGRITAIAQYRTNDSILSPYIHVCTAEL